MNAYRENRGIALLFFNYSTSWGWVANAASRPFKPRKRPGTYCTGGWVVPRAGLDGCGKSHPQRDSTHRTVQLVASRYTNCAIPAHKIMTQKMEISCKKLRYLVKMEISCKNGGIL